MSDWNPHRARFRRLSGDEMQDRIDDGYHDEDPPEDRPLYYERGRAARKRRTQDSKENE